MNSKMALKISVSAIALLAGIVILIYLRFTMDRFNQPEQANQSNTDIIKNELTYIEDNYREMSKEVYRHIDPENIFIRNCYGILEPDDKSGLYKTEDKPFKGEIKTDLNKNILLIYNVCSYKNVKDGQVNLIFTTKKLMSYVSDNELKINGEIVVPGLKAITYKKDNGKIAVGRGRKVGIPLNNIADLF